MFKYRISGEDWNSIANGENGMKKGLENTQSSEFLEPAV